MVRALEERCRLTPIALKLPDDLPYGTFCEQVLCMTIPSPCLAILTGFSGDWRRPLAGEDAPLAQLNTLHQLMNG